MDKFVVLVPVSSSIEPACEQALHQLERRGIEVRRAWGFSAIDLGRSVLVSEALEQGAEEILWVDSDIMFNPDDVEKLRGHKLPIVTGIYAKKRVPEFACKFLPGCTSVNFGKEGGLVELLFNGMGFFYSQRGVYEQIAWECQLPTCNAQFGQPFVPYFLPQLAFDEEKQAHWYLSEDYAFCLRAREAGFHIMADTTIRLHHIGPYPYTWEDVCKRDRALAAAPAGARPHGTPGQVAAVR